MADKTEPNGQRVLRVNQLDAAQLDDEITQLLRTQLSKAFQYFEAGALTKYEAELNALLRLLVWRFSVYKCDGTVGQLMLNMKYSSAGGGLSKLQKLLVGFFVVGLPYLKERLTKVRQVTEKFPAFDLIWRCLYMGEKLFQFISVINFLVFLQKGRYPSLLERFLRIHPVFAQEQSIRRVSFEFMTRELLWHGFAEFVFFFLPLVNIHKLKNMIVRRFSSPATRDKQPSIKVACHECGICSEPPTAPHQGQCAHVFCYYCVKANCLADPFFPCPLCGQAVGSDITPVESTVALEVT
ncbi:peroxisome biogenesis factor 2-like [Acropora millepora]|uniref:peroxisome biogenesis factor 2-like n=1 Tax=Acropora millepora TaxID=45264 RepID=UPI001CF2D50E|nr:peroxisome biogenesis factor 2-like [Acropora millepora]XP_044176459.1 peroxisome biogenesis factor 2-like [Acropora millepora]XP_044176467.1 peroxisome biogenesis factor 2-like [Acropora millepora]XP_044176471.1 peroxisome biogenesis factor 2-like [Acropora millepora]